MELNPKLVETWKTLLQLSALKPSETVLLLVGADSHPLHVAAARFAVSVLGSRQLTVRLDAPLSGGSKVAGESTAWYGPSALDGNRVALLALKEADLVIDLMGMYRGAEQEEILATGTRILLVKEPPEVLMRLVPRLEDKALVKAGEAKILKARKLRVTSDAGTDFEALFGEYPPLVQYGFADEPGRWDHAPSAFIARWPDEGSSSGTVVLDAGDTILPFKDYVRSPIRLTIADGFVTDIAGAGLDARYMRDYIESFNDPDGFAVSHLGWGLHPRAHWTMLGMYDKRQTNAMDARSYAGNFMFSLGPNAEAGGPRHTPCHLDIPMSGCSLWLDDRQILDHGKIVG